MKYYAVSFGEWIELRQAMKPPKEMVTEISRGTIKEKVSTGEIYINKLGYHQYRMKTIERPITLKVTAHEGGRVICAIRDNRFFSLTRRDIERGQMIALTDIQAQKILDFKGVQ